MIGYWGEFEFNVSSNKIYTFNSFGRKSAIQISEQELEGNKPSTYIKGTDLETISFEIDLKASLGVDVKSELDRWRNALYAKSAKSFVLGNKPLTSNKFLLISVDENESIFDQSGGYISSKIALSFKEYVRGGSKEAENKSKSSGAVSGGVIDKLDGTRYNVNAKQTLDTRTRNEKVATLNERKGTKTVTVPIKLTQYSQATGTLNLG